MFQHSPAPVCVAIRQERLDVSETANEEALQVYDAMQVKHNSLQQKFEVLLQQITVQGSRDELQLRYDEAFNAVQQNLEEVQDKYEGIRQKIDAVIQSADEPEVATEHLSQLDAALAQQVRGL